MIQQEVEWLFIAAQIQKRKHILLLFPHSVFPRFGGVGLSSWVGGPRRPCDGGGGGGGVNGTIGPILPTKGLDTK